VIETTIGVLDVVEIHEGVGFGGAAPGTFVLSVHTLGSIYRLRRGAGDVRDVLGLSLDGNCGSEFLVGS